MTTSPHWRAAVAMARRTHTARGRAAAGLFTAAGTRMVRRALQAGWPVPRLLVAADFAQQPDAEGGWLLQQLTARGCDIITAPAKEIRPLTRDRVAGPLVALLPLPDPPDLAAHLQQNDQPLLVVAVDIQDPGNLGALVRTAHAGGATFFICSGPGDPFHLEAVRTSLGSIFKLPVLTMPPAPLLPLLAAHGIETAAAAGSGETPLPEHHFAAGGTAVFLGNEAAGLPADLLARVDRRLAIPMAPGIDSFSVNAAAAIFLYEIEQQRRTARSDSRR